MQPEQFYTKDDYPQPARKGSMWAVIRNGIGGTPKMFLLFDRRSFVYGMAACLVLVFSSVGLYTTVKSAIEYSQPQAIKLDRAYQSAIQEFEKVAFQAPKTGQGNMTQELFLTRKEQLQLLEKAIEELRSQTNAHDLSEMKRSRLRHLYGLKLRLLQEMVEQGEIEL